MKKSSIKFIILIAFIVTASLGLRWFGLTGYLNEEELKAVIENAGLWGPVVFMLIYLIAPSLMLPGLPITVIGGILFGPVWGTVYVIFSATGGATLAFLISRYMGREWVEAKLKSFGGTRLKELDAKVADQGWKVVAFTRLIPLFPFNFLNYAFGLTKIRLSHYVLASFIFMLPGAVAYVVFSSSLLDIFRGRISPTFIIGIVLVIAVSLIPIIYKRRKGHKHV